MLRLKYLIQFSHTENVTWDYLPIGYWSAVESHVGVMVACLPAIRSLQSSIQRRLFPKPATQPSYYEDGSKDSSNKKSSRKDSHSRILSSIVRSRADKEDFVQLNEFDTKGDVKSKGGNQSPTPSSFERSLTRSCKSSEDILPLANSGAPMGQPMGGIMVQSEYSVDRTSELRKAPTMLSNQELAYRLGGRI
jgi:hypothetical protein